MPKEQHNIAADGLRGLAAANVVFAHFVAAFLPSLLHNHYPGIFQKNQSPSVLFQFIAHPFVSIFYNGHFPVIVFFVLSGYVLALPFWHKKYNIIKQRFWSRYLRLNIPIAFSIILSYFLCEFNLYENGHAGDISGSKWLNAFFDPNKVDFIDAIKCAIFQTIAGGNSFFNPPLWTLKIEFVGSLILLGVYSVRPTGFDELLLLIVCFFLWVFFGANSIYYMCFFFGAIMGKKYIARVTKFGLPIFIAGYFLGAFAYEHSLYNWLPRISSFDTKTFYNVCGAILMVGSLVSGFGKFFFESHIPRFLGKISYSLYLIHFLVLCSVTSTMYIALPKTVFYLTLNFIGYIIFCLATAVLFEYFIDSKAINFSKNVSSKIFSTRSIE
jgi:peptidoglycan/LPS O-acetylase OafA/YrhL